MELCVFIEHLSEKFSVKFPNIENDGKKMDVAAEKVITGGR